MLPIPLFGHRLDLRSFVPDHFHNVWTVVAFALIASTVLKGIFDYGGTYLANYAGYGMVTDLRNELHSATLRRSVAFFQKYSTGTLLSAIVNDVERVQFAMSTRAGGVSAAVLHFPLYRLVVVAAGRAIDLGAC